MKVKDWFGNDVEVTITVGEYYDGNTSIRLWTKNDGPWGSLTVNLPDMFPRLEKDYAFVDTNNMPDAEEFIKKYKLGKPTGLYGYSGYCKYPLYQFNLEKLGVKPVEAQK